MASTADWDLFKKYFQAIDCGVISWDRIKSVASPVLIMLGESDESEREKELLHQFFSICGPPPTDLQLDENKDIRVHWCIETQEPTLDKHVVEIHKKRRLKSKVGEGTSSSNQEVEEPKAEEVTLKMMGTDGTITYWLD